MMANEIPKTEATRLATPYAPAFNFTATHSVTLPHPLSTVFPTLAYSKLIERGILCYGFCSGFQLYHADAVQTPASAPLADSRVRNAAPAPEGLPRQWFRLQETIPLLFGLVKQTVEVVGCQTWDEDAKVVLYESVTNQGIIVWKLRTFEEIQEGEGGTKTKVTELIRGTAPAWMRWLVQREASKAHTRHMEQYHTLF